MADKIKIPCPECDRTMLGTEEVLGKKVKCKNCGAVFVAAAAKDKAAKPGKDKAPAARPAAKAAPAAKPKPAKSKPADEDEDANPYGVTDLDLSPRCPECANEMESAEAVICLTCGYNTQTRTRFKIKKVEETTGMDVFLWLLPGIACAVGVVALFIFNLLFDLYADEWLEKEWYSFLAHGSIKMWMGIISCFIAYGLGYFAVKRLIFNNQPPEVERRK